VELFSAVTVQNNQTIFTMDNTVERAVGDTWTVSGPSRHNSKSFNDAQDWTFNQRETETTYGRDGSPYPLS
jgi:hypothetical protein